LNKKEGGRERGKKRALLKKGNFRGKKGIPKKKVVPLPMHEKGDCFGKGAPWYVPRKNEAQFLTRKGGCHHLNKTTKGPSF